MSSQVPELIIGGVTIPIQTNFDVSQAYNTDDGSNILTFMNGNVLKQTNYERLQTVISGSGNISLAVLDSVDFSGEFDVGCIQPLSFITSSLTPTVPRTVRADFAPTVLGLGSNHALISTPSSIVGQALTITAVAGVTRYHVSYLPVLTVVADRRPNISGSPHDATSSWSLSCIESLGA